MSMLAPLPLGLWATHRGEREVYLGVTLVAAAAAVGLAYVEDTVSFALCWGLLSAPPSMRGVRAAYFARTVADELSRAGQLASALGLVGSVVGPLVAAADRSLFLDTLRELVGRVDAGRRVAPRVCDCARRMAASDGAGAR